MSLWKDLGTLKVIKLYMAVCIFFGGGGGDLSNIESEAWYYCSSKTVTIQLTLWFFYTPVWKTDVLCRGNVRPSVCPSVRPSVRPGFPDFSSTCFEISIWNLVYTFSRWHDMSSLSCITIGSLWPSLQPKVGQTHFLQSWPHKSR